MNEEKNTYCYKLLDGDEVVKYGITTKLNDRENHYNRRKERGWVEYTDFVPDDEPLTEENAKNEETNRIKDYENKHGKKPRYNKNY